MLDLIVHVPDLPILSQSSPKLGFGLWRHMPIALTVELALSAVALVLYLHFTQLSRAKAFLVGGVVAVAAVLTAVGPYVPGEPPRLLSWRYRHCYLVLAVYWVWRRGGFKIMAGTAMTADRRSMTAPAGCARVRVPFNCDVSWVNCHAAEPTLNRGTCVSSPAIRHKQRRNHEGWWPERSRSLRC
jgi:hypothetical protein